MSNILENISILFVILSSQSIHNRLTMKNSFVIYENISLPMVFSMLVNIVMRQQTSIAFWLNSLITVEEEEKKKPSKRSEFCLFVDVDL